ncbi:MAG TPA: hypothetical protein VM434_12940 [Beijerinckiaceae bacterium]|nr:hypothetical protein [Beijerinckiaceae bacterium]
MSDRRRLPGRRLTQTASFVHDGHPYVASWSRFEDGTLGEIFLAAGKANSTLDVLAGDAAMAVSLALQHGCPQGRSSQVIRRQARPRQWTGIRITAHQQARHQA